MGGLSDILAFGDKLTTLADSNDLLEPLGELGKKWSGIAAKLNQLRDGANIDSIGRLIRFLKGNLADPDVAQILDEVGLKDKLAGVIAFYDDLPEGVKRLAAPLSDFSETPVATDAGASEPLGFRPDWVDGSDPGEVKLPIPKFSKDGIPVAGSKDFHLKLSAEAEIACEAGALWPYSRDKVAPGLLQLTLDGDIGAGIDGKVPFQGGALTAGASAGGRAGVMFFHRPADPKAIFAVELARMLPHLPNPFELRSVWNAMATSDGLEGMIVALDGHAEVAIDLSLGQSFDIPKFLNGALKVAANVSLKRQAAYVLSVRRIGSAGLGQQKLLIALSRNRSAADKWGLGIGLDLDFSPVIGRVHDVLAGALDKWSAELKQISPYLTPGTWLRNQVKDELASVAAELIGDADLRAGLIQDLGLLLGTEDDPVEGLVPALAAKLQGKLDEIGGAALEDAKGKAVLVAGKLTDALPSFLAAKANKALTDKLEALIEAFEGEVKKGLDGIVGQATPVGIANALKAAGVQVSKAVKEADDAVAELRNLIAQFDKVLLDAVAISADAAKRKIGLQLSAEDAVDSSLDMEIVGMISADPSTGSFTPDAERVYGLLLSGKLSALRTLFDRENAVPGFTLDTAQSSIRRFSKVSSKIGFTFVGFGLELSTTQLISGEAEMRVLGNGDVSLTARADVSSNVNGPSESRTISLVSTYSMLLAKADDDGGKGRDPKFQQLLSLGVTASQRDKSLTVGDVHGFLARLGQFGLILPSRVVQADNNYRDWSQTLGSDSKHPAGDLSFVMRETGVDVQALLALGRAIKAELVPHQNSEQTRAVFNTVYDAILATRRVTPAELSRTISGARERESFGIDRDVPEREWVLQVLQALRIKAGLETRRHRKLAVAVSDDDGPSARELTIVMAGLNAVADILQLLAEVYDATPADIDGKGGWTEKDYRDHEAQIAEASAEWITVGGFIFWFSDKMSLPTVTFLVALVALSLGKSVNEVVTGALGNRFFSISMTRRLSSGEAQPPVSV